MEGRSLSEVTHLALLGVKIRETAFWDNAKEKKFEYIRIGEYKRQQKYKRVKKEVVFATSFLNI